MSERTDISAEEALILITCACSGSEHITAFMRRAKIRPARAATITDAILGHYRTRGGYDLRRFAADVDRLAPIAENAA